MNLSQIFHPRITSDSTIEEDDDESCLPLDESSYY